MSDATATSESPAGWLALPGPIAPAAGVRWALRKGEDGRPGIRRIGEGVTIYHAGLIDTSGRVIVPAELWVQEVWPTLCPLPGELNESAESPTTCNALIDAAWEAMRATAMDDRDWSLGDLDRVLSEGPLLYLGEGLLEAGETVCRDDFELAASKLPPYGVAVQRYVRSDMNKLIELDSQSEDVVNPGGGRMWLRPAAAETLGEHLARLESSAAAGEGLLLAGRDAGSRWVEVLHLKLRLIRRIAAAVRTAGEAAGRPLLSVSADAFDVAHIPAEGSTEPLVAFWSAEPRLVVPSRAVPVTFDASDQIYFLRRPDDGRWPTPRDEGHLVVDDEGPRLETDAEALSEGQVLRLLINARGGHRDVATAVVDDDGRMLLRERLAVGRYAVRWVTLPSGTLAADATDVARLTLMILLGPHDLATTETALVDLIQRLLETGGPDGRALPAARLSRLDSPMRLALREDSSARELLGPQRLVGGWARAADAPLSVDAASAIPHNAWARLLTAAAAMLPPFGSSSGDVALDGFIRTVDLMHEVSRSLMAGTWRINRDVGAVLRKVSTLQATHEVDGDA